MEEAFRLLLASWFEILTHWRLEWSTTDKWDRDDDLSECYKTLEGGRHLPTAFFVAELSIASVLLDCIPSSVYFSLILFVY